MPNGSINFLIRKDSMKYHGEFEITITGQIVLLRAAGSWNEDTAIKYADTLKSMAEPIKHLPWGLIIDATQWEMGTPETNKIIGALQQWSKANNQKYKAMVIGDSKLKEYQIDLYYKGLAVDEIDRRYFAKMEEAVEWFREVGLYQ